MAEEIAVEESVYARHMVFRGQINWRKYRQVLVSCIFNRQFKLAFSILESMLHKMVFTQEHWMWRFVLIVLANLPDVSDNVCRQCFRMLHFTKTADYDERRLCFYFLLEQLGKRRLALETLEKDMPRKMHSVTKRSMFKGQLKDYEIHCRARTQMIRAMSAFWKPQEDEENGESYVFTMLPPGKRVEEAGVDDNHSLDRSLSVKDEPAEDIQIGNQSNTLLLYHLQQPGDEIMGRFNMKEFRQMFRTFITSTDGSDYFIVFLIEMLEKYDDLEYLESILLENAQNNPVNPWAVAYVAQFYLKHKPDHPELRWPYHKKLAKLDPFGKGIGQLCADYLSQENPSEETEDRVEMFEIVFKALSYAQQRSNTLCWAVLARLLRDLSETSDGGVLNAVREHWLDACNFWPKFHFRVISPADKEDGDLLYYKLQVCMGLFGSDAAFVGEALACLVSKKRQKLEKSRAALQTCHQILAQIVRYPLFAPQKPAQIGEKPTVPKETETPVQRSEKPVARQVTKRRKKAVKAPVSTSAYERDPDSSDTTVADALPLKKRRKRALPEDGDPEDVV